ncbi:MAG TPA: phospholipid-binding protein [Gammaproteobacteria bacterium]|nr:phospholipid-binding protein [Gammaproteobacteria bacterium]
MKLNSALILIVAITIPSCTAILTEATGDQGIQEKPTERTTGAIIEDEIIETKVAVNMRSQEPAFKQSNFHVISHNGVVLLVGQVENDFLRAQATEIASQASSKIKRIHNELEIAGNAGFLSRSNDAWIATKIRTLMLADGGVPSSQVKVISENGAVYLMGLVSQTEGDSAASLARNVSGVTKVVKVFEYLD